MLEMCTRAIIFVFSLMTVLSSCDRREWVTSVWSEAERVHSACQVTSMLISCVVFVRPTWRSVAPVAWHTICHGTRLLWCSATDTTTWKRHQIISATSMQARSYTAKRCKSPRSPRPQGPGWRRPSSGPRD